MSIVTFSFVYNKATMHSLFSVHFDKEIDDIACVGCQRYASACVFCLNDTIACVACVAVLVLCATEWKPHLTLRN